MYLYEAIRQVLEENGNVPMRIEDIANAINQKGLYRKKNGCQADPYGVGLRAVSDISKSTKPIFDVLIKLRK